MNTTMGGVQGLNRGDRSGLWHPHYHAVWLCRDKPDHAELSAEWHRITGDSLVVDVRPFDCAAELAGMGPAERRSAIAGDFVEVAKYALKFSSLTLADNWQAFRLLSGRRLVDAFDETIIRKQGKAFAGGA